MVERFGFGQNWRRFNKHRFTEERVLISQKHLLAFLGRKTLADAEFLDIGCGSGLHSLAAFRAGAKRIFSFDFDPDSVEATRELHRRAGSPADWRIERGDVLDEAYVTSLGKWPIVYSWGVLHHTGDVWRGVRNAQSAVAPDGLLYLALYSADMADEATRNFWLGIKKAYNDASLLKKNRMLIWYMWEHMLNRDFKRVPELMRRYVEYKYSRGMDLLTDARDWLGGWPMEYVPDQQVVDCLGALSFRLEKMKTGEANTEFLFRLAPTDQSSG